MAARSSAPPRRHQRGIATDSRSGDDRFVAWTTVDGITWSTVELPQGAGAAYAKISVAWSGDVFVAASSEGPVWSSADGTTWTVVGDQRLRHLVAWSGRVVAVDYGLRVSPPLD